MRGGEDESGGRLTCVLRFSWTLSGPGAAGWTPRLATPGGAAGALRAVVARAGAKLLAAPPAAPFGQCPLEVLPRGGALAALVENFLRGVATEALSGSPSASGESGVTAEGATQPPGFSSRCAYAAES